MRLAVALLTLCACSSSTAETTAESTAETAASTTGVTTSATTLEPTSGAASSGEPTGTTGAAATWDIALQLGTDKGALLSVWGPAADDIYAVGGQPISAVESTGVLYRYDGAQWSEQPLPAGTPMLHWIFGVDGELWTVGRAGTTMRREGDTWVTHPTGVDTILWGIWGAHKDALWTVGGDGVDDAPVLLGWDGAAWSPVALPPTGDSAGLFKVWGSGADDVTAVGDRGLALRFDGVAWAVQPTGDLADLISVWGRAPDQHLAVGGRASARIARWNGAAWTGETLALPGLSGVWMDPSGAATIVGNQGTIAELPAGSMSPELQDSPTLLLLHAVFGAADGSRFAVGGSLNGAPPYVGVIVQRGP
jgi:hypothetical protein